MDSNSPELDTLSQKIMLFITHGTKKSGRNGAVFIIRKDIEKTVFGYNAINNQRISTSLQR